MKKDALIFLGHILDSIGYIESFSNGLSKSNFETNRLKQSAIIREIEIIGEAVKNLPIDFTVKYPQISWSEIAGTRDKIIHYYFGVDLNLIWDVIKKDLPILKKKIKNIEELEF
ncbi:DUF86 domain-containing protein [archaeon]|nr:DUF86 domain-containing protein [archaeon]